MMKKGVNINCKVVTDQLFIVVGLLVGLSIPIQNQRVVLGHILPFGNLTLQ